MLENECPYYNTAFEAAEAVLFLRLPFIIVGSGLLQPAAHGSIYIHHGNAPMQSLWLAIAPTECLCHPASCAWLDIAHVVSLQLKHSTMYVLEAQLGMSVQVQHGHSKQQSHGRTSMACKCFYLPQ